MSARTLHIVDGESTGGTLRASRLTKSNDILCWKDALYTGPVPAGLSLKKLSQLRSRFWTAGKRKDEFKKRDAQLLTWKRYDEIVLWFGATSVCQLSLAQILTWFSQQDLGSKRASLVTAYGGMLRPKQLSGPYEARKKITAEHLQLASRFWNAFTSPTPDALQRVLKSDLHRFPEFRDTINELLQEYPSRYDGLSRLERKLLLEIASMGTVPAAFAVGSVIRRDWVGDVLLFDMLRRFVAAPNPLLSFGGSFSGKIHSYEFNGAKLRLTRVGQRVLEGMDDHVVLSGIDRWIGGVHLRGIDVNWRWDERKNSIVHIK